MINLKSKQKNSQQYCKNISAIVSNVILLRLITNFQLQLVWRAYDTWKKKNVFRCMGGSDQGKIITSINWTLGIDLSLKSLNDKSPLSPSPPSVSSGFYPGYSASILSCTSLAEPLKLRPWPYSQANIFGFMPAWTSVLN